MRRYFWFGLALLVMSGRRPAFADENLIHQVWNDGKYIGSSPARLDASDWPWFLGAATLLGGAVAADRETHHDLKEKGETTSSKDFANFGDTTQLFAPLIAVSFWTAGLCRQNSYTAETGRMAISSLIWSALTDTVLKVGVGRIRPSSTQNDPFYFLPLRKQGGFASGHTTIAFSMATLFSERYPSWKVAVPAYITATAVGFSRVYADKHWASDVVGGALLGFGISHTIVSRKKGTSEAKTQVLFDGRTLQWVRKF